MRKSCLQYNTDVGLQSHSCPCEQVLQGVIFRQQSHVADKLLSVPSILHLPNVFCLHWLQYLGLKLPIQWYPSHETSCSCADHSKLDCGWVIPFMTSSRIERHNISYPNANTLQDSMHACQDILQEGDSITACQGV